MIISKKKKNKKYIFNFFFNDFSHFFLWENYDNKSNPVFSCLYLTKNIARNNFCYIFKA